MLRRAFTLIELLVVIAIIAILAAILFPVFAKARERAKLSVCINNQKQVGLAMMQYVEDSDGTYPQFAYNFQAYGVINQALDCPSGGYDMALRPYLKTWDVFACPSQPYFQKWGTGGNGKPDPNPPSATKGRTSYGYSWRFVDWPGTSFDATHRARTGDFKDPAGTIFLAENEDGQHVTNEPYTYKVNGVTKQNPLPGGLQVNLANDATALTTFHTKERHFGRTTYIFSDGHVRNLLYADTKYPRDMWTLNPND